MKPMYYTTSEVRKLFGWQSSTTMHRKRASGFLPEPDLAGKPNRWLRTKIDAIIGDQDSKPASDK